jgi:hypothetical protein
MAGTDVRDESIAIRKMHEPFLTPGIYIFPGQKNVIDLFAFSSTDF